MTGIDPSAGPAPDAPVPRRVLELLRKQLDTIVTIWASENAVQLAKAEEQLAKCQWAQNVLNEAKRLQELKRPTPGADSQTADVQIRHQAAVQEPPTSRPKLDVLQTTEPLPATVDATAI